MVDDGGFYTIRMSGIYKVIGNIYGAHIQCMASEYPNLTSWTNNKCECGSHKTYAGYPNLEYLHSDWCPLYLDPNWLDKINKQEKESKKGE